MTRLITFFAALLMARAISSPAGAQEGGEAVYAVIHADIHTAMAQQAEAALKEFAAESRKEEGSLRFEVWQEPARKNHFALVEVWQNQDAYRRHIAADRTGGFGERFQPLLASPLDEHLHRLFTAAITESDSLIVPGERVGALRVGGSLADLRRLMGEPGEIEYAGRPGLEFHPYPGLIVAIEKRVIADIIVTGGPYRLLSGVSVGSTQQQVLTALGRPVCQTD
ncbi:MAG: antibiotic biosynthesis monooxygenase, partial [Alphaproteobacteria bacterium]|nr:antibiotic biosynthesis monooxygenase [Alphaproteobacteria bacterium]